jgi:hypothetical protein
MGYSCTKAAAETLDAIFAYLTDKFPDTPGKPSSNGWRINGRKFFFERGRENPDGAITGSVWEDNGLTCHRIGTAKIAAQGFVIRFPGVSKKIIADAILEAVISLTTKDYNRRRSIRPLPLPL